MSTLSVPLTAEHEETIDRLVKKGYAANKAEAVRKAITLLAEEEAVQSVLIAEQEAKEGKLLKGDLAKVVKNI